MSTQNPETNAPPSKSNIETIVLPEECKDESSWDQIIDKFKTFRLLALGESPEAFSSTAVVEKAFSKDIWASRLTNSRATHLLVIHSPNPVDLTTDSGKIKSLLGNEWIAQTVLLEIAESEVAKLAADRSPWHGVSQDVIDPDVQHKDDKGNVVFVLNGVYVAPGFRHLGVGSSTLKAVIDEGVRIAISRGFSGVHFQVRVNGANTLAVKLYQRAGFEHGETERLLMAEKEKNGVKIPSKETEILVMHRHIPF